jgi:hypothetical protein
MNCLRCGDKVSKCYHKDSEESKTELGYICYNLACQQFGKFIKEENNKETNAQSS